MPINALLSDPAFDPDTVAILASAFETAWEALLKLQRSLAEPNHADATRERLARPIVLSWQMGERTTEQLVASALAAFSSPERPPAP
jgi:hypothetical protein